MMKKARENSSEDVLKAYFNQIKKTPLLTFDEELELSRRIMKGDEQARKRLIESNLRLVVKIAKAYVCPDVPLVDLIQEGNMGLIHAAQKYDYGKNVRFSTYANWWIKQSITRALANKRRAIRLPHRKEEALRKIQRAYNLLSQMYSRAPDMAEISAEVGIPENQVREICQMGGTMVSLDAEIGEDGTPMMDLYEDYTYEPEREVIRTVVREETLNFLDRLMEREKQILMYRFQFNGAEKYTLKRIGEEMGISPETVRQIEMRALRKLREQSEDFRELVAY